MNVILIGPPFSGKTTQAKNLSTHFGIKHISTGEILRSEIRSNSEIGSAVKDFVNNGLFAPDYILNEIFKKELHYFTDYGGFLLDGYPRNRSQLEEMEKILNCHQSKVDLMISLAVPENEWIKRAENRAKMELRTDDSEENIVNLRFKLFNEETKPLKELASHLGIEVVEINAIGHNDEVFGRIIDIINSLNLV
jgi:adenylate kinase